MDYAGGLLPCGLEKPVTPQSRGHDVLEDDLVPGLSYPDGVVEGTVDGRPVEPVTFRSVESQKIEACSVLSRSRLRMVTFQALGCVGSL